MDRTCLDTPAWSGRLHSLVDSAILNECWMHLYHERRNVMLGSHAVYPAAVRQSDTKDLALAGHLNRRGASIRMLLAGTILVAGVLTTPFSTSSKAQPPTVVDIGGASGFQDGRLGHLTRGRMCVAADFDSDGRIDFFFGSPGDESIVIWNGCFGTQTSIGGRGREGCSDTDGVLQSTRVSSEVSPTGS